MMTKAAKDKEKFNPATSFKEAAGSFFVFGTKIIYGPPLFCWFYSLIMHFCVFAFGELLVENNSVFALYHKAFSVFAFVGFLVKMVIHRFYTYVSIITKNPQTLTVQGLLRMGLNGLEPSTLTMST